MPRPQIDIEARRRTIELAREVDPPDSGQFESFEAALESVLSWAEDRHSGESVTVGDMGDVLQDQTGNETIGGGGVPPGGSDFP